METKNSNYPSIHYVIQGKSSNQNGKIFDEKFVHINPLVARKMAFDFFEYNIQLLESKEQQENKNKINYEFIVDELNVFSVAKKDQNIENQGVCLYLVISNTIVLDNKTELLEERFLIYAETFSTPENVIEMKKALLREYGLYKYLNIETSKFERTILSYFGQITRNFPDEITILKTPFDFKTSDFETSKKNLFDRKITSVLNNVNHEKAAFISNLDWHNIRIQVSSFLNTGNGYIFLGNIKNTNTITSVFESKSSAEIRTILEINISKHFPNHHRFFSFEFATINKALIVIIVFKPNFLIPSFYDNETNNNFYFRDKNGINLMNKTARIVRYLNFQKAKSSENIQDVIKRL